MKIDEAFERLKSATQWGLELPGKVQATALVGVLLVLGFANALLNPVSDQPQKAEAVADEPEQRSCFSSLGGEARSFSRLVRDRLRNPSSFEHVQTQSTPGTAGVMIATMKYRATNGFGAVDTAIATGEVRLSDCAARILTME